MKTMLAAMICIGLMIIFPQSAQSFLDVGGEYGASWLKEHGGEPKIEETRNNLWNWGSAPKGFEIYNGTVYPPGYAPSRYYPYYAVNSTPIIINSDAGNGQQTADNTGIDPWLTAQLSGRPVTLISEPKGVLF
ncbi:hypothetical protein [Methanothrix sp.]|jgi:hypothetical protein|uniref:hypothetical protein n=1 Tax=Methanothrix sp. TaxID=90426 RepID=UPI003BB6FEC6